MVGMLACARTGGSDPSATSKPEPSGARLEEPPAEPPKPEKTTMVSTTTSDGVTLSWKMTRRAKAIEVWYRVENGSDERIYVCDELLVRMQKTKKWRGFPTASLQNIEGSPDTAQIVIGTPPTDANSLVVPPVTYKPVEAGAALEDTRGLPLPLESYNVMGMTRPLDRRVEKAVLIVHSFRGEPPSWRELPGEEGTIRVPEEHTPANLRSDPLPLP